MPMPRDIGVIDTMIGLPVKEYLTTAYKEIARGYVGGNLPDVDKFPAGYMFKGVPEIEDVGDPVEHLISEMDRVGIDIGAVGFRDDAHGHKMAAEYPDRFFRLTSVDPNRGMDGIRDLEVAVREHGVRGVHIFPAGLLPQVPINDKKMYPIYAKCVELDIPIFLNAGVPGPRVPMDCQYVGHFDEVCWFFPELRIVARHGCEPWEELMVKLMIKWPNLHYSPSAFAPKHYPQAILDYANTRGADKFVFAGYYPAGLSLDRTFAELDELELNDDVWPKFLRENALRIFGEG